MDPRLAAHTHRPGLGDEERRWLDAFRNGDRAAFQALLGPHLGPLFSLARRQTRDSHHAEDLMQEVLVRAVLGLTSFRGDSALRTWLFKIMVRLATEPERWSRAAPPPPLEIDVPDQWLEPPDQGAMSRELGQRLDEAMERLPARQRTALHLRAVAGMDYAAVAEVLECSPGAARMLVLEARRKVMERLQEHLDP
jgi:RNA polymerase sigma-70 factor (ECF subfamily)